MGNKEKQALTIQRSWNCQRTGRKTKKQHMKKPKLVFDTKTGLRVYEGNELHFNDYLRQQVGAGWYMVRNMLYEAGCGAMEIYEYREKLLQDFREICRKGNFVPVIYK